MLYVTREELKTEVRTIMGELRTAAKDLGGDITTVYNELQELKETVKLQEQIIRRLCVLLEIEE